MSMYPCNPQTAARPQSNTTQSHRLFAARCVASAIKIIVNTDDSLVNRIHSVGGKVLFE